MSTKRRLTHFEKAEHRGVQRGGGPVHISIPLVRVLRRLHEEAPAGEPKERMTEALEAVRKRALKEVN